MPNIISDEVSDSKEQIPESNIPSSSFSWDSRIAPEQNKDEFLGWRHWLACVFALCISILWFEVFGLDAFSNNVVTFTHSDIGSGMLPGLGATLLTFALLASAFVCLGKHAKMNKVTVSLLVATIALALIPAVFADVWLQVLDMCLLAFICPMELFLVSGLSRRAWDNAGIVLETVRLFFSASFSHLLTPIYGLPHATTKQFKTLAGVCVGLGVTLILFLVIIPLLVSADSVFGSYFENVMTWLEGLISWNGIWRIVRVLILAPIVFSFLFSLMSANTYCRHHENDKEKSEQNHLRGRHQFGMAPYLTALIGLNLLYLFFVAIQFIFFFDTSATTQAGWNYSQYARSGFFQLVAVATINLTVVLSAVRFGLQDTNETAGRTRRKCKSKNLLQALCLLLTVLTCVILVCAYRRMDLYISVYGLSLLRILTIFMMLFIAVCLIAVAIKTLHHRFPFFRLFLSAGIILWIGFNALNVDAQIAQYNVNIYLNEPITQSEEIDLEYLSQLSPDVVPALQHLVVSLPAGDTVTRRKAQSLLAEMTQHKHIPWQTWSWALVKYQQQ